MEECHEIWEQISFSTYRTQAPKGWIVKEIIHDIAGDAKGVGLCFLPDEEHSWKPERID